MAKGIREAPSKGLIGELAEASHDSPTAAFGLRQSMMVLGGLVGSLAAGGAIHLTHGNYVLTFALSTIPATLALLLLTSAFGPGSPGHLAPPPPAKQSQGAAGAGGCYRSSGCAEGRVHACRGLLRTAGPLLPAQPL